MFPKVVALGFIAGSAPVVCGSWDLRATRLDK